MIGQAKQEFIMRFLADCSIQGIHIQGPSIVWQTHYGNSTIECQKTDPLCKEITLERQNIKCTLTYSDCRVNLDLERYNPMIISFQEQSVELTPTLLMDYGLVYQMIFSNPEQTYNFGRKIARCVLNSFVQTYKSIELLVESKPPERSFNGGVYPTQHLIYLKASHQAIPIFGTEIPGHVNTHILGSFVIGDVEQLLEIWMP